ncbi:NAD-binding protein [Streptomyces millisiae]|uniref:NAD-binding protein n=1 Tax=Streptomyces millisiae TaxID=3075542 RepID=A0ABU2LGV0_9ACTN|nr:NAD-binding protein [Streptomyces sp. DSM 44918]MDT0316787.1 NAD-binding protein [Streptomyces sp. DSM 44918]
MIVCGDDALAARLAAELHEVYRERVTLVVPPAPGADGAPASPTPGRARAATLLRRVTAAVTRPGPAAPDDTGVFARRIDDSSGEIRLPVEEMAAAEASQEVLRQAGVEQATALALVYEDDEANIRVALAARRLNPRLRLVIRLYNRKLGEHLARLLDQAAAVALPEADRATVDAATTILSDADTAAPALAATAVAGTSKIVEAEGLLLRAVERPPPGPGQLADPGLCVLALLSSTTNDPAGAEGSDSSGPRAPQLLPDEETVAAATGRGTMVLETVAHAGPRPARRVASAAPLAEIFSRRLRWAVAGVVLAVLGLAVTSLFTTPDDPVHATYLIVLDLFSINEPAIGEPAPRQVLQLLSGLVGLALLPILVAGALEALGAFRGSSALRRPSRALSGHVVLLGLGKIGTRVLGRLKELDIPVVCVEEDPEARGVPLARRLRVPVVLGDVTQEGVLEAAKIERAGALLALTSSDTTNLEAALYARSLRPDLRVALRLYDDDFASAVYRTLRAAHPGALTRSRSVSSLAAPAFAGAMMGRQILGAMPVERRVLLFAAVEVAGHAEFEGRTVAEANRPGAWRVVALDTSAPADRHPDLTARPADAGRGDGAGLLWELHPGYVLRPEDRVVLAATRRGLAELLGRLPAASRPPGGRRPGCRTRRAAGASRRRIRPPRRARAARPAGSRSHPWSSPAWRG